MEKIMQMDHMGPIRERRGFPPWAMRQGWGPSPPMAGAPPPLGSLVPHGGGKEDGTPLGLYKEGYTPIFPTHHYSSLSLSPSWKWTPLVWSLHLDWSSPP